MATAYAALTSLMHLISDLHEHPHPPIKLDEEHIVSLSSKLGFFQRFLEDHHTTIHLRLEIRIADAARAAEVLIESHMADRVLDFHERVQRVIQGFDLIQKQIMETNWNDESQANNQPRRRPMQIASPQSPSAPLGENMVVGIEDAAKNIVENLTPQHKSGRQVISITGMGGIGKTTLARKVYNHPYVKHFFDIHAWATISKDYKTRETLVELLYCLDTGESVESLREKEIHELGEKLHKSLFGLRYLVILDDVWDVKAWEEVGPFLPASSVSGIVITTRESIVASIGSHNFGMNLLDESKSWELFCKKVFGQDSCPPELEDIGMNIANNCGGLPLLIVVIGGYLSKSPRTRESWNYVACNLSSIVESENNDHCLRVFSLSYTNLPIHLKPCFLYMGIMSKGSEIRVSRIIRDWMVHGILKPITNKNLEEAAEEYINDLISRNLILASKSSPTGGKLKSFKIHDLLIDFCLKEALEKKFFSIVQKQRLSVDRSETRLADVLEVFFNNRNCRTTRIRTLSLYGELNSKYFQSLFLSMGGGSLTLDKGLTVEYKDLVNLQWLKLQEKKDSSHFNIPASICLVWNLQHLDVGRSNETKAPPEIWKMSQLRHINVDNLYLPDPPSESNDILKNLQSARMILNFSFNEDFVKRVPNLKNLKVAYGGEFDEGAYFLNNIARLEKLESLNCSFSQVRSIARNGGMLPNLTFPHLLKKLTISNVHWDIECIDALYWTDVTTKIGSLALLEVLRMYCCKGRLWKPVEGQFVRLKYLELFYCYDLECFKAESSHFPCLEQLILYKLICLKEISSDMAEIPTLRSIELHSCPDSAVVSAKEIADYQYETGNDELQIEVVLHKQSRLSSESLSSGNFHVN